MRVLGLAVTILTAATAQTTAPISLECKGEEPFWGLKANGSTAVLSRLGKPQETYRGTLREFPFLDPAWAVWRGSDVRGGRVLSVTFRQESCPSTMAEGPAMSHRAVIAFPDGSSAVGCCNVIRAAAKPAEDWSRLINDLLPAINRCIADSLSAATQALKAWPMNHGKAGVRLSDESGRQSDCVADMTGKGKAEYSAPAPGLPGVGNPLFLPARGQPPQVECGRLEKVLGPNGATAGWLQYDPCKP